MWKSSDIDSEAEYVIQLCHDAEGQRSLRLRILTCEKPHPDALFETEVVSHELLRQKNIFRIAKESKLMDGGRFEFDAHGIWFTPAELDALEENDGDMTKVPWCSKTPPRLAPR